MVKSLGKIVYSVENKEMGTAAPIKLIKNLPQNFLVINGDILTNLNFSTFYKNHLLFKIFVNCRVN